MTRRFALTFDYRCPYGRIAHDHVVTGLRGGADWDVTFVPYSLGGEGVTWERETNTGLLALEAAVAVRDTQPDRFLDAHFALYEHRHSAAGNLRSRDALGEVLASVGVDDEAVWAEVDSGRPAATIRREHEQYGRSHNVWGVPTFVVEREAVFVRLLDTADGDAVLATATVNRILDQIDWPILNEFKHTAVPR